MSRNELDPAVATALWTPQNMFTDACSSFDRLMAIARGGELTARERNHLGHGCSYCEMTLRQSFSLACPDAVDRSKDHVRAWSRALAQHAAACPACRELRAQGQRPGPLVQRSPATGASIGGGAGVALRRAPVQVRAQERIQRVLDAAELVFADVGYEAATTNQIAAMAETSIGSIYEFFGNKQAVARALGDRYLFELTARSDEALSVRPPEGQGRLARLVDAVAELSALHPGFGPLLRSARGSIDLRAVSQALESHLVASVERALIHDVGPCDPARRKVVATNCMRILGLVLDGVATEVAPTRASALGEIKLALSSYVAAALPPDGPIDRS